jgi:hypothetical protein
MKWTKEKARRYLDVFEVLRVKLGNGQQISDKETARRLVKRQSPHLDGKASDQMARTIANNVSYFRRIVGRADR